MEIPKLARELGQPLQPLEEYLGCKQRAGAELVRSAAARHVEGSFELLSRDRLPGVSLEIRSPVSPRASQRLPWLQ